LNYFANFCIFNREKLAIILGKSPIQQISFPFILFFIFLINFIYAVLNYMNLY